MLIRSYSNWHMKPIMLLYYAFLTVLFTIKVRSLKPEGCDVTLNGLFHEGILGQVGMFPWLGVIRVELHEGVNIRTALTGAILIQEKYALTIADDIARIPKKIFERDSRALFIPTDGEPWLFKLKKYKTHPEYPSVKNTIAVIELEIENQGPVPLVPICWQTFEYLYNASNPLYVLGITDANDVLEKEVYKVQYLDESKCVQWYETKGFNTEDDKSTDYKCVFAVNSKKQCVFETGMVLASNATGTWTLIGFGIYGAGCALPSRFIEMYKYFPWIESTTGDMQSGKSYGTKVFGDQNVPIHQMFRSGNNKFPPNNRLPPYFPEYYEFGFAPDISRINKTAIVIFNKNYEMEQGDCFIKSSLIYSDSFKIRAKNHEGKAFYQLSLMDLSVMNYTCVLVRVEAHKKSNAMLWYNYGDYIEESETPRELLKKYPLPKRDDDTEDNTLPTTTKKSSDSKPKASLPKKSDNNKSSSSIEKNTEDNKGSNSTAKKSENDENLTTTTHTSRHKRDPTAKIDSLRDDKTTTESVFIFHRHPRRLINNNKRYKYLVSDSVIDNLLAIKNELETTRIELNTTGKADIHKTFKKMFAIKGQLHKVQDKLGSRVPDSLKDSINILDKAASELRAGQVFYEGKLMDIRQQEIQQSIDLIKEFREEPEDDQINTIPRKFRTEEEETKKTSSAAATATKTVNRPNANKSKKKLWRPHKLLEKHFITDKPGWWAFHPHLNLELDFEFNEVAEMKIEVWSHRKIILPTQGPWETGPRIRNYSEIKGATPKPETKELPEIDVSRLIEGIDPKKLPDGVDLGNATLLLSTILPKKLPGNTTLKNIASFIDPEKLPQGVDIRNATFLIAILFDNKLPKSFLRQKFDDAMDYIGSLKRYFRKDNEFGTYSDLKRAELYDDVINVRGIDFFDDELTDRSDIIRSDTLLAVAIVLCVLLRFLDVL